jgi:hypothetical protein
MERTETKGTPDTKEYGKETAKWGEEFRVSMTAHNNRTREEILAMADSAFSFLDETATRKARFVGTTTVVAYVVGAITIELEFDWRERSAFLLVARTVSGERPPGYYTHNGVRMRRHLANVLADYGGPHEKELAAKLRTTQAKSGADAIVSQVSLFAGIVRATLPFIQDHATEIFPTAERA